MNAGFKWGLSPIVCCRYCGGPGIPEPAGAAAGRLCAGRGNGHARARGRPKLASALGQQFIVENRPGASGGVAAEALVNAPADGHVLMVAESGTLALPAVNPNVRLASAPRALAAQGPAKGGKIRVLAVTSPQRVPGMPEWPALAETLPEFSAAPNVFLVAPAATPAPAVQKLSTALRAALASRDVEETFDRQGAALAPSSSAELARQIADEVKRWAGVVKEAGIKVDEP